MEVVQFGRIVSPPAFFTSTGGPVDVRQSTEFHGNRADLDFFFEFEGDVSCDSIATREGAVLVINVIIDAKVCYRLLEHHLKSS